MSFAQARPADGLSPDRLFCAWRAPHGDGVFAL